MIQKELNEENKEIKAKAYELYVKHGFKNGNSFVDWLEAEKQVGIQAGILSGLKRRKDMQNILIGITGILGIVVVILFIMLFKADDGLEQSRENMSQLKVMMLVLDQKPNEEIVAFGDTHFDFNKSTLSEESKLLLEKEVSVLKEKPDMKVRMAGYTSAEGSEESNQVLSEKRANEVRNYLIGKGIAAERITTIGYGRTKPALYEVSPGNINTKEAKANMRVLFEITVK